MERFRKSCVTEEPKTDGMMECQHLIWWKYNEIVKKKDLNPDLSLILRRSYKKQQLCIPGHRGPCISSRWHNYHHAGRCSSIDTRVSYKDN